MVAALSAIAMSGLMVGCASSKGPVDPVVAWQTERFNATEIAAANDAARPLTIEDVLYKSTLEQDALAAPVNAVAMIPAALYLKVVTEVDQLYANHEGRLLSRDVEEAIAMGQIKDVSSKTIKAWIAEDVKRHNENCDDKCHKPEQKRTLEKDWKAYLAYFKSIAQQNQDSLINDVVKPMLAKLAEESVKVAPMVLAIKEDPTFKALAGFELIKANKNLLKDADALTSQFNDTIAGANHWLTLLENDKAAKNTMKNLIVK